MKKVLGVIVAALTVTALAACSSPADVASYNLSQQADQFQVERRVVFFNGITDTYLLTIEGRCSIEADGLDGQLEVTCMTGENQFVKHFLGLSDNVTYFVEQTAVVDVDTYHYQVIFRPETIIPNLDLDVSN